ncbi:MAG: hypothetical protein HYR79_04445 [Nitrospirae bacterium]|nr:hypothetical protein [Nitrospirota bacterium]
MNLFDPKKINLNVMFFTVSIFMVTGLFMGLKTVDATPKYNLETFSEPDFGFSVIPPTGWRMDEN